MNCRMRTRALLTSKTQPNVLTLSRGSVAKHCTTCSLHQGAHHGARGAQQGKWPTPSSYSIPRAATQQESSPGLSDQPARPQDALLRLRTTSAADARLSITSQPRNPPSAARAPHASARDSAGGEDQLMACSRGALPRDTPM